ncbi:MAG: right-handed parallel beta-helix repeat-containing protein [Anaerolineae bacterium]|jgi:parallel beta-helix repeat protein
MTHRWLIGVGVVLALAAALALIVGGAQPSLAENGVIYVDADATGLDNGQDWTNAYTGLQAALADAEAGQQIWVAAGTYKPTDTTDRAVSFQMKNGVAIYGGFAGGETELGQRDWVANSTILSGDLNNDDGPDFANREDNSYHVLYHPPGWALDDTAVLDGFTITGGNANGDGSHNDGAGIYNYASSPALVNCILRQNWAADLGGGMLNTDASSPKLSNCAFKGNYASSGGGIMNNVSSSPELTNCAFEDNEATGSGGGIYNYQSSPTLTGCSFSGNSAQYGGGLDSAYNSEPELANCTFANNHASIRGGGMSSGFSSSPTLTNCTFYGNEATDGGGAIYNYQSSPALTNCILWGDTAAELPDEILNESSSPDITYCDIQGGCDSDPSNSCGDGNIDADPLFLDPGNGDYHLGLGSPGIDAGSNTAPYLPETDFEGDPRIMDGDGDGDPIVDMGVDEVWARVYLPLVLRNH